MFVTATSPLCHHYITTMSPLRHCYVIMFCCRFKGSRQLEETSRVSMLSEGNRYTLQVSDAQGEDEDDYCVRASTAAGSRQSRAKVTVRCESVCRILCPLTIHLLSTHHPLAVHSPSIQRPLAGHSLSSRHPLAIHSSSTRHPLSIHSLFTHRPLSFHTLFTCHQRAVHSPSTCRPLTVYTVSTRRPLAVHSPSTQSVHAHHINTSGCLVSLIALLSGAPKITVPSRFETTTAFEKGENVVLKIPFRASPRPSYKWHKDGQEIQEGSRYKQEVSRVY